MACYGTGGSDPSSAHSESTISYLTEKVPLPVNVILLLFIIPLCFFTLNLVCEELLVPTLNVLCGKLRLSNETGKHLRTRDIIYCLIVSSHFTSYFSHFNKQQIVLC